MKYLLILSTLLFAINTSSGQVVDWKWQVTKFVDDGTSSDNPGDYYWYEETNIKQGIRINLKATEDAKIFVEAANGHIEFSWSPSDPSENDQIRFLSVKVGAATYTIYNGNSPNGNHPPTVIWNCSSVFNSPGEHFIEVEFKKGSNPLTKRRQYKVFVVPTSNELHRDIGHKNTMRVWKSPHSNAKPFVMSVGLDFYNIIPEQFQRYDIASLFECLMNDPNNPHDIYILYYRYNPQDLRNNAAVFASAVSYVSNAAYSGKKIAVGGRSMGGLISRYALAKAEDNGNPLPVTSWTALDSPHQGANISPIVLDFLKEEGDSFRSKSNNNDAAKTMLLYNPYDPTGVLRQDFYNELNALNGSGFPHITHNIGVAFADHTPNPESGIWLRMKISPPLGIPLIFPFGMTVLDKLPGSYLPRYDIDPILLGLFTIDQYKDPTFMPYKSALDISDFDSNPDNDLDNSRFDVHVTPDDTYHHNKFPEEIAGRLATEIIAPQYLRLQNVTIDGKGNHRAYNEIYAGDSVRTDRINGEVKVNATDITFQAGNTVVLKNGFTVTGGTVFAAIIDEPAYPICYPNPNGLAMDNSLNERVDDIQKAKLNENNESIEFNTEIKARVGMKIYPNPVRDRARIDYTIAKEGQLNIVLYDSNGRAIRNLANELTMKGNYQLDIDTSDLAKGMYFIRLTIGAEQLHEKIIKL